MIVTRGSWDSTPRDATTTQLVAGSDPKIGKRHLGYEMSGDNVALVRWEKAGEGEEDRIHFISDSNSDCSSDSDDEIQNARVPEEQIKMRASYYSCVVYIFSMITMSLYGYEAIVISGALLELESDFSLDRTRKELLVSATLVAAAIGAAFGGILNEKLGRKKTIMISTILFVTGDTLSAGAPPVQWGWSIVLAGRFISGLGIGIVSMTVPIYLAECAPVHIRGRLLMTSTLSISGGQMISVIIDYGFSFLSHGWRYMFGFAIIPAIVCIIAFVFLPESPRWLVGRGHVGNARAVLRKLRAKGGGSVEKELGKIQENLENSAEQNSQSTFQKIWTILTTRHLLLALIVGSGLQTIKQLGGINAVMAYSPTILRMSGVHNEHMAIGLGAVIALSNFTFSSIGLCLVDKIGRRKLILTSLAGVIISLLVLGLSFYLLHESSPAAFAPAEFGSNTSLTEECHAYNESCAVWRNCDDCVLTGDDCHYCAFNGSFNSKGTIGLCISSDDSSLYRGGECSVPEGSVLDYTTNIADRGHCYSVDADNMTVTTFDYCPSKYAWFTLVTLVIYIGSFTPGIGPVPWTVNAEIYPNWARSVATSISTFMNWFVNILVSVTFLHLSKYLSRHGLFWLYSGIAIGGWVFIFLLLPETKGISLEQTEELFKGKGCPPIGLRGSNCRWECSKHGCLRIHGVEIDSDSSD